MPPALMTRLSTAWGYGPSSGRIFPVTRPAPQPEESVELHGLLTVVEDSAAMERPRTTHWPAFHTTLRSHPRLDCSMPYSAATPALMTPGGKCTPLMKRMVREESGAWLLLKKAAVRATPTA